MLKHRHLKLAFVKKWSLIYISSRAPSFEHNSSHVANINFVASPRSSHQDLLINPPVPWPRKGSRKGVCHVRTRERVATKRAPLCQILCPRKVETHVKPIRRARNCLMLLRKEPLMPSQPRRPLQKVPFSSGPDSERAKLGRCALGSFQSSKYLVTLQRKT